MELDIKRKNGFKTIIAYLVIFNIISVIIGLMLASVFKAMGKDILENYYFLSSLINLSVYVVLFATLWVINKKDLISDCTTFGKSDTKKNLFIKVLAGYGIFYAINLVGNTLISNIEFYADFANNVLGKHTAITSTAQNQTAIVEILYRLRFQRLQFDFVQ